eukprot:CAMPEP_0179174182 /NCGR_PEP_ID=MMETSP0796-20121207/85989_1 /TAXON_ID=73915 /ORGANISM="Pyrodinium bahamense, Strain pbaha01" /LENGTH=43 /DNA_ID= /DNA_START= /DNA_END= /DNA_ORIENTATION=
MMLKTVDNFLPLVMYTPQMNGFGDAESGVGAFSTRAPTVRLEL